MLPFFPPFLLTGPVSRSVETLVQLMEAGMSIVRLNFSHGTHDYHAETIANAREAINKFGMPIAIALDTKGPEIRTGLLDGFADNPRLELSLEKGAKLTITNDDAVKEKCTKDLLWMDYENLSKVVKVGDNIYVDDGLISLEVLATDVDKKTVEVLVVNSGNLGSKKGVNLPNVNVDLPAISEKDHGDILFGIEQKVDMIFASFIRKRKDVQDIRELLGEANNHIKIISKIENHEGMQNFDEILDESDGIMVARGDLGIEIPAEKVFVAQKMMIAKCNMVGKPVICATQMLESMIKAPRPTRAEGSDVANAVIDGADCVMLSGETAKGDYPVPAVAMMAKIAREAECAVHYRSLHAELRFLSKSPMSSTETCALAAVDASLSNKAKAIICLTTSGRTGRLISKWRPLCPIIAVTRTPFAARQMQLNRGVTSLFYGKPREMSESWSQDVDNRFFWAMEQ
eukprot:UC1_evm1s175